MPHKNLHGCTCRPQIIRSVIDKLSLAMNVGRSTPSKLRRLTHRRAGNLPWWPDLVRETAPRPYPTAACAARLPAARHDVEQAQATVRQCVAWRTQLAFFQQALGIGEQSVAYARSDQSPARRETIGHLGLTEFVGDRQLDTRVLRVVASAVSATSGMAQAVLSASCMTRCAITRKRNV